MYGMAFSSHSTGMCVMTSIGEMSPAMMQILRTHCFLSCKGWHHVACLTCCSEHACRRTACM